MAKRRRPSFGSTSDRHVASVDQYLRHAKFNTNSALKHIRAGACQAAIYAIGRANADIGEARGHSMSAGMEKLENVQVALAKKDAVEEKIAMACKIDR